jgi:hypothetical protein
LNGRGGRETRTRAYLGLDLLDVVVAGEGEAGEQRLEQGSAQAAQVAQKAQQVHGHGAKEHRDEASPNRTTEARPSTTRVRAKTKCRGPGNSASRRLDARPATGKSCDWAEKPRRGRGGSRNRELAADIREVRGACLYTMARRSGGLDDLAPRLSASIAASIASPKV